jgi:2-amino-4-hydroxy-6-hydroxymethyldihydropteridine diphosphokinase
MIEFRSNVVIALGSNQSSRVGLPQATVARAIAVLPAKGLMIRAVSRFFATPCFPAGAGPDYVNAVVMVACDLDPPGVLSVLHRIEARFGRTREKRWGMRTLDLDLLAFAQEIRPDAATQQDWVKLAPAAQARTAPDGLILPHPRLQDRAFVLVPMADVVPAWIHPVLHQSVSEMCANLPEGDRAAVRPL